MSEAKVGLVVAASPMESGGERVDEIINKATGKLENCGLNVVKGKKIIWNLADAIEVAEQLTKEGIDLLIIIHATWISDTIQYILVTTIKAPVVLWGLPFVETFSIPCMQHFGSVLWERQIFYKYVYGLPEDEEIISTINDFALTAKLVQDLKGAKIALIGPRQTWRAAGATDMTSEEWELTDLFGAKIIHIEMDELIEQAKGKSKEEAEQVLQNMKQHNRLGKVEIDEERLTYACKIYLGIRDLFKRYNLTGATAECYPKYSGITNLPAAWLADDNVTMETEGDIGHTILMLAMRRLGKGGAVALTEVGKIDFEDNCLWVAHEGSSAYSLAESSEVVHILEGGDEGTVVGFPFKPMEQVTVASLVGKKGTYRMFISKGKAEPIMEKEWVGAGRKLIAKLRFDCDVKVAFSRMLAQGVDHHLLLKEGNITSQLADLCNLLGIRKVYLEFATRNARKQVLY